LFDHREAFLALMGRVDDELFGRRLAGDGIAEQDGRLGADGRVVVFQLDNLAKILVDRFLVVNHEHVDGFSIGHAITSTGL